MQTLRDLIAHSARPDLWFLWAERGVRVLILLGLAWVFSRIVARGLGRLRTYSIKAMERRGEGSSGEARKRADTLISVMTKLASSIIWLLALVMALTETGFQIAPLLAGLGVAGLALGLGAQTLIKDWLGGLFLLLEDQLRIGDIVTINGISGKVQEINLRSTLLRGENGAVHVIANGSITALSNLTRDYSFYLFEFTIAYHSDADRALAIFQAIGSEVADEEPFRGMILAPLEVYGVDKLGERGAVIKGRIKTLPSKQWDVGREINRRIKARLEAQGIAFPAWVQMA